MIRTAKHFYRSSDVVGWLTLVNAYSVMPKPGATSGVRWSCQCRCGTKHDASHENLRNGRVRACRKCAKAYRAFEDAGLVRGRRARV